MYPVTRTFDDLMGEAWKQLLCNIQRMFGDIIGIAAGQEQCRALKPSIRQAVGPAGYGIELIQKDISSSVSRPCRFRHARYFGPETLELQAP